MSKGPARKHELVHVPYGDAPPVHKVISYFYGEASADDVNQVALLSEGPLQEVS
jgi:hypothetical protein